jgi:hypothetical protein
MPPPDSALQPFEKAVLNAFRKVDSNATTPEHGFDDAWVEARVEEERITVHVAPPGALTPGTAMEVANYSGIRAQAVSTNAFGKVWRFPCRLEEFGDYFVDVAFANDPARVVPAVYQVLGCSE